MEMLKMIYENKGPDDDFEIIYIPLDCEEDLYSFPRSVDRMPWLIHAFAPDFSVELASRVFGAVPRLPAIAAFGTSGHLETKESKLALKVRAENPMYPFIESSMDEEVKAELIAKYKWDLDCFGGKEAFCKN